MIRRFLQREIRREIRSGGYTDLVLRGIDSTVSGSDADALATAAVEGAAGLWARALAAATVTGTNALPARIRHRIGRDLIRVGESVYEIRVVGGRLHLEPASHWDVIDGWRYKLDFNVPPGKVMQRTVPREGVLHLMWSVDPREPWRGLSPFAAAPKLNTLIARVENKLAHDLNTPTAHLIPVPQDGGDASLDSLRSDIGDAAGGGVIVESVVTWAHDQRAAPRHDWRPERLGPKVPETLLDAYRTISDAVYTACGIPASLAGSRKVDGTQLREDYRRFVMSAVEPVASMLAEVASEALETDVRFAFGGLWARDLQGRASAFEKLVRAGMDMADARRVAGVE